MTNDTSKRIYLTFHNTSPYVVEKMTTPSPCVPDLQFDDASGAVSNLVARGDRSGVKLDVGHYVVVGMIATGEVNLHGVPTFVPDWYDCTSAASSML